MPLFCFFFFKKRRIAKLICNRNAYDSQMQSVFFAQYFIVFCMHCQRNQTTMMSLRNKLLGLGVQRCTERKQKRSICVQQVCLNSSPYTWRAIVLMPGHWLSHFILCCIMPCPVGFQYWDAMLGCCIQTDSTEVASWQQILKLGQKWIILNWKIRLIICLFFEKVCPQNIAGWGTTGWDQDMKVRICVENRAGFVLLSL